MIFKVIFTAILFSISISLNAGDKTNRDFSSTKSFCNESVTSDYTYVRVFKDGIWWIYVYDGRELVDVYPE